MPYRLGVLLSLTLLRAHHACNNDNECLNTCVNASAQTSPCQGITCSADYDRCVCAGAAALLRESGGCVAVADVAGSCSPTHDVLLNVGVTSSSELSQADLDSGSPSSATLVILRESVAAALDLPVEEVIVTDVQFITDAEGLGDGDDLSEFDFASPGAILHFDWQFSFCSTGAPIAPEQDKAGFEHRLGAKATDFAAFLPSVIRILTLEPRVQPTEPATTATPEPVTTDGSGGGEESSPFFEQHWWLPFLGVVVVGIATVATWLFFRSRSKKFQSEMTFQDSVGVQEYGGKGNAKAESNSRWHEERFVARVIADFDPSALPDVGAAGLHLTVGELVEVEAESGPDWVFGHAARAPDHAGLFPRRCVERLGAQAGTVTSVPDPAPPAPAQASAGQGKRMKVTRPFSSADVPSADAEQDHLLFLEGGEDIEVIAAAEGWLYGRVDNSVGYFPEYCVAPVPSPAEAVVQQQRQQQMQGPRQSAVASRGLSSSALHIQRGLTGVLSTGGPSSRQLQRGLTGLSDAGASQSLALQGGRSQRSLAGATAQPSPARGGRSRQLQRGLTGLSDAGASQSMQSSPLRSGSMAASALRRVEDESVAAGGAESSGDQEVAIRPSPVLEEDSTKIHLASDPELAEEGVAVAGCADSPEEPRLPFHRSLSRKVTTAISSALWGSSADDAEPATLSVGPSRVVATRSGKMPLHRTLSRKVTTAITSTVCAGPEPVDW